MYNVWEKKWACKNQNEVQKIVGDIYGYSKNGYVTSERKDEQCVRKVEFKRNITTEIENRIADFEFHGQ